ncbi:uncharacterized protein LOC143906540 [Temnothorax americanus]|uniref:uncharacterized protein LOC143906540 n=1 Tax=Temnothorax americanus TaxID=1964332 RepID=UPI004067652D
MRLKRGTPELAVAGDDPARRTKNGPATWPHLKGLPLADAQFLAGDPVELLLGAEVCSTILEEGLRKGGPHAPIAQKTAFGWILSGGCGASALHARGSFQATADNEMADLVRRFWEQEAEPSTPAALTPDEQRCEDFYVQTHSRTETGRYVVRLPFSKTPTTLSKTCRPAERLLTAMERKFHRDARFGELYREFMREYEDLKHMELATVSPFNENEYGCFLPHHGVLRESSSSTKLRVVFNGSQETVSGESLNHHLLTGANLLPALADVLTRWRWHRYAFVTDIEKMYRQILIHPDDRTYQCILWRCALLALVCVYRLRTVTYGLACAPFLAIRTLQQLARDEQSRYPQGAIALRENTYVDDVVSGANTLSAAIAKQAELRGLCTAGGFPKSRVVKLTSPVSCCDPTGSSPVFECFVYSMDRPFVPALLLFDFIIDYNVKVSRKLIPNDPCYTEYSATIPERHFTRILIYSICMC